MKTVAPLGGMGKRVMPKARKRDDQDTAPRAVHPSFLRSKAGAAFLCVLGITAVAAVALGIGMYGLGIRWFEKNKVQEATTVLKLAEAFVESYTDARTKHLRPSAPVPATFRAHSIQHFNEMHGGDGTLRLDWLGVPGRAIRTEPRDAMTAAAILEATQADNPAPRSQWLITDGIPVFRTIAPSVAHQRACVDCHNQYLDGRPPWRLGDVMGAFVIDVPTSGFQTIARREAMILGGLFFLIAGVVAAMLFQLQHKRHLADVDAAASAERERAAVEARRLAEAANEAKSRFLAMMSHELRTPLNAINGFSEVMAGQMFGPIADRYRIYAEDIHRSGRHLLTLIGDILDVAKAEAGRLELIEAEVALEEIVEPCLRLIAPRAAAGRVHVSGRLPPGIRLFGDATKLRQVVLNLVSNAVKFTPEGGRVEVKATLAPDGDLTLAVIDTGVGLRPEDIPRAFMPFEQIDHQCQAEGTGLGLPLAKALVELHGGFLELTSMPGLGTTAVARLPSHRVLHDPAPAKGELCDSTS